MKKIAAIFLPAVMILGVLSGCASSGKPGTSNTSEKKENVVTIAR